MKKFLAAGIMFLIGIGSAYFTKQGYPADEALGHFIGGGTFGLLVFGLYQLLNWISLRADRKSQERDSN